MKIETELTSFKTRLDPRIEAYFDAVLKEASGEDELVYEALRHVKELALAGGKRLRAAFMYYGYQAAGGTEEEKILETSIAIELIHLYLLIHDDIIDRDDLRHGVPTLHRRYADFGKQYFSGRDAEHFGNSIALIAGDMVSVFGNDIIFRSSFPKDRVFEALIKLQKIVLLTAVGEARDIYVEYKGEATEEEILRMYQNKTARYTVEGPLHLGAILAGAPEIFLSGLSAYAVPLGIAFQIQDDILGVYGSSKRLGKPIGSDIAEGKMTLLVLRALEYGTLEERVRLHEILRLKDRLAAETIEEFRNIVRSTGALDAAKALAARYIEEGRQALSRMETAMEPKAYAFLYAVAEYMENRQY